ncbi:MAG: hypothetical protein ACPGVN_03525 [Alphaproteobacteria bacterium]
MFRLIGFLLIVGGLALLGWHLFDYFMMSYFEPTLVGAFWFKVHPDSLQLIQPAIERYLTPVLWQSVIAPFLSFWLFAVMLGLGTLMLLPTWFRAR